MMFGVTTVLLLAALGVVVGFFLGVKDLEQKTLDSFEEGLQQGIEIHRQYVEGLLAEARKEMEDKDAS